MFKLHKIIAWSLTIVFFVFGEILHKIKEKKTKEENK